MKSQIIRALNQLNQDFYNEIASEFDQSRQFAWPGWERLSLLIAQLPHTKSLRVLDLASGNDRFLQFLGEKFLGVPLQYLSVDSNPYLLTKGWEKSVANAEHSQLQLDIVDALINESLVREIKNHFWGDQIDVIVCFGFLHHIPSTRLRRQFIDGLLELLNQAHGLLALTAWQFAEDDSQRQKIVSPTLVGIDPTELEHDDYILSWNRGKTAYRYCHHVDQAELEQLLPKNAHWHTFLADGKSGKLNRYLVWQKSEE